jgi:hypothetical protein
MSEKERNMKPWGVWAGMVLILLCAAASKAEEAVQRNLSMGTLDYLDARYGFRSVQFGTTLQGLGFDRSMQCYKFDIEPTTCRRSSDKEDKTFGAAELFSIDYVFFQDNLMAVDLWINGIRADGHSYELSTEGKRNGQAALAVLQQAYGKGQRETTGKILWKGKRASAQYAEHESPRTPIFSSGPGAPFIRITIWNNELASQFKTYQQNRAKARKRREREETKKAAGEL